MLPEPEPVTPPVVFKPRKNAAQDKRLANDLTLAEQMLLAALAEEEGADQLSEGGYTPEEIQVGLGKQRGAMLAFIGRQEADARQIAATEAFNAADKASRTDYTRKRGFAKSAFMKDAAGWKALGLNGSEPKDQQDFITAVTALLEQGKNEQYALRLAKKGVTPVKLAELSKKIDDWKEADQAQNNAIAATIDATAKRDAAARELYDWLAEYKQFARTQFKDQPAIAKRLLL